VVNTREGVRLRVHVLGQVAFKGLRQLGRDRDGAPPRLRLGRPEYDGAVREFDALFLYADGPMQKVDPAPPQAGKLPNAKRVPRRQQYHRLVPWSYGGGDLQHLVWHGDGPFGCLLTTSPSHPARVTAEQSILDGGVEHRSCQPIGTDGLRGSRVAGTG
jgi:hypothetical protein